MVSNEINNQTVVLTLIAAIVISLGGTVVVLTKLSSLSPLETGVTGFATANESGQVQIQIESLLSIDVVNNTIDFGTCTQPIAKTNISSAMTYAQINLTATNCSGGSSLPRWIRIINDGNQPANISVETDTLGSTLLNDVDAKFAYRLENATDAGCAPSNLTMIWTEFSSTGFANRAVICEKLNTGASTNKINFFVNFTLTPASSTLGVQQTANLVFHGESLV